MSIHQQDENKLSDKYFEVGNYSHLVSGNVGRVLDGRRTPGFIEKYDPESAMFIWRITDFEDKGEIWEMPAESISSFQFELESKKLAQKEVEIIEETCEKFSENLIIKGKEEDLIKTEGNIKNLKNEIKDRFIKESEFIKKGQGELDIKSLEGSQFL
ncbi:MAG: hypothetical protein GX219_04115 [Tissierellia bacterium]|nr:hypothetical protein [Tissierellia bacterium]